ncbi:hypothetical protein BT96DRAFT_946451 [Gymnopus androsaceus JB14]|uniref:Uncharacterized protein n=1 Tax=Gymnopus androsaceus JB14 TaxID=1447944 RepID=A0A6A4GYC0_9AGAR|nr:hypothetical protein BT96DRAFT_946451 [Gymnopus androsaceus JB14]
MARGKSFLSFPASSLCLPHLTLPPPASVLNDSWHNLRNNRSLAKSYGAAEDSDYDDANCGSSPVSTPASGRGGSHVIHKEKEETYGEGRRNGNRDRRALMAGLVEVGGAVVFFFP